MMNIASVVRRSAQKPNCSPGRIPDSSAQVLILEASIVNRICVTLTGQGLRLGLGTSLFPVGAMEIKAGISSSAHK